MRLQRVGHDCVSKQQQQRDKDLGANKFKEEWWGYQWVEGATEEKGWGERRTMWDRISVGKNLSKG